MNISAELRDSQFYTRWKSWAGHGKVTERRGRVVRGGIELRAKLAMKGALAFIANRLRTGYHCGIRPHGLDSLRAAANLDISVRVANSAML